jgi:hypothetical protein
LQIFGYNFITSSNFSGKFFGWGDVNLNLTFGAIIAAYYRRLENLAPFP